MRMPLQIPPVNTLPAFLNQHKASPMRMFMASRHNLNRMSVSWFHSLLSPFLSSFIPTSSYSRSSWPRQLFSGECILHSCILYLISAIIYYLLEKGMWCLFLTFWTFTSPKTFPPIGKVCTWVCARVHVVYSVHPLYSAHLRRSWTVLQATSALFGFQHLSVRVCRGVCPSCGYVI